MDTWEALLTAQGALPVAVNIDHLSPSQLRSYLMCGTRYYYERIAPERVRTPARGPMLRGKAIDEAATAHFQEKVDNGEGLKIARFTELAVHTHEVGEDETIMDIGEPESRDRVAKQARVYHGEYGRRLNARSREDVQRKYRYEGDGIGVPVEGIIDLITDDGMIVDTKIKRTVPKQAVVDEDLQLTTYAMFTGLTDVALAIVTDAKDPKPVFVVSKRRQSQIDALAMRYRLAHEAITKGVFMPVGEGSWHCNAKWCPFHPICPFGHGESAPVSVNIEDWQN